MQENRSKEVDAYIAGFPDEVQEVLNEIRNMIFENMPDVTEKMSYKMPAYMKNGPLFYYAAYKNHIGFYPTSEGIKEFEDRLSSYKWAKGSVQFPLNKPIPYDFIYEMMKFRYEESKR